MGRQEGIFKIKGQLGGISFYKTKDDGYLARQKGGIDAQRLKFDPAFQRTRENGQEFGRAGRASKLLRTALGTVLLHVADGRMVGRLTREMLRVIQADSTNARGERNVLDGETELLNGFEFNQNAKLSGTFAAPFSSTIDRASGTFTVAIPAFVPAAHIAAPAGATHFKLLSAGVAIDFEQSVFEVNEQVSEALRLGTDVQEPAPLVNQVTANQQHPMFLAFGIAFYQEVNGTLYALRDGASSALSLVAVDGGVA